MLRVVDVPHPAPGPGDLAIEVEAAEILFLDTQLRSGWGQEFFAVTPPFVPGVGVAGAVVDVGPGVERSWLGATVVSSTSGQGDYRGGGYADVALTRADRALRIPAGVAPDEALTALSDGAMAISRIERSGISAGGAALVTAASGGIAIWLIPLLHAMGVDVTAAAFGRPKVDLARSRGANTAVDYGQDGWTDGLGEVDVVFDGAGGDRGREAAALLRPGGRFLAYGAAAGAFADLATIATERDIEVVGIGDAFSDDAAHHAAARALEYLASGSIHPVIGQRLPLERAPYAHVEIEARRVMGKSVPIPQGPTG